MRAIASERPLMARSLCVVSYAILITFRRKVYHFGSSITVPSSSGVVPGRYSLQLDDNAQILKAEAIGPNVPAKRGPAVDSNQ